MSRLRNGREAEKSVRFPRARLMVEKIRLWTNPLIAALARPHLFVVIDAIHGIGQGTSAWLHRDCIHKRINFARERQGLDAIPEVESFALLADLKKLGILEYCGDNRAEMQRLEKHWTVVRDMYRLKPKHPLVRRLSLLYSRLRAITPFVFVPIYPFRQRLAAQIRNLNSGDAGEQEEARMWVSTLGIKERHLPRIRELLSAEMRVFDFRGNDLSDCL